MWNQNLCRICGEAKESLQNLANSENILQNIEKCLRVSINFYDDKPKQLCLDCINKLEEFSNFIDTFQENENKFSIFQENSYDYGQHTSVIVPNKQIPLEETKDFQLEEVKHIENQENGKHIFLLLPNESNVKESKTDDTRRKSKQKISVKKVVEVNGLLHNASIQKSIRINDKVHKCPRCDRQFMRRQSLNAHITNHTNIKPFKCEVCEKSFGIKSELTTHKTSHSNKHQCNVCLKTFTAPSKLSRHIRIHTNEKPFLCEVPECSKAFSDKRNLEGHKVVHIKERPFNCSSCSKQFKTMQRLKLHIQSHDKAGYNCNICKRQFKSKHSFSSHNTKHNCNGL